MSTKDNKKSVQRIAQDGWSRHNLSAFDEFFSEEAIWHGLPPEWGKGIEQIKNAASFWFEAVPDFAFTVEDLTAEEDRVAFRWTAEGTHKGELFGVAPTNKHITFSGIAIQRFKDGKCVDYREFWDQPGLMEQLGATRNQLAG